MGSAPSQPASQRVSSMNEKQPAAEARRLAAQLSALKVDDPAALQVDGPAPTAHITLSQIEDWRAKMIARPGQPLASTVLSQQDFSTALLLRKTTIKDRQIFNTAIDHEASPVCNQQSSGRCWLFATMNIARLKVAKKLEIAGDFELSQSYLFAWDHVEKSNQYLELSIELAEEPLDSRLLQYLNQSPLNDGGQYDMVVNLITKYGIVPKAVYPESWHSSNSGRLDQLLTHKVREYSLAIRRAHAAALASSTATTQAARVAEAVASARRVKTEAMGHITDVIFTLVGTPPLPDETFEFEYKDTSGKVRKITSTPLQFVKYAEGFDPADCISVINDPRNEYGRLYTVDKLNNVHGARPVLYVNAPAQTLSDIVVARLKANEGVWFGCDSGAWMDAQHGVWDTELYDYDSAFGVKLGMTRKERLQTGDSSMTHAMHFVGVHLDEDGKPLRYRIENSWGDARGDKGYFLATQRWFEEFVYQVVAPRGAVPKELRRVFEEQQSNPVVLPPWDPMVRRIAGLH